MGARALICLAYWSLHDPPEPIILDEPYTGDTGFDAKLEKSLIDLSRGGQAGDHPHHAVYGTRDTHNFSRMNLAISTTLETEQTRETPRDEEPRKEKGEPTEQLIIHKLGRTGFLIYISMESMDT